MEKLTKSQSELLEAIKKFDYIRINSSAHSPLAMLVINTDKGVRYKQAAYTTATSLIRKNMLQRIKTEGIYITHYKAKEVTND